MRDTLQQCVVNTCASSTPSSESIEWEKSLDNFSAVSGGLFDVDVAADVDFDQCLLANFDDFFESMAGIDRIDSPILAPDVDRLYEQIACKLEAQALPTRTNPAVYRHGKRKRKTADLEKNRGEIDGCTHADKRIKQQDQANAGMMSEAEAKKQTETVYRRRYDILHTILEAWNTGGIEDLEEIAANVYDSDVTLINPDFLEGLHGVDAVMAHWNQVLDVFPDGLMEEYVIECEGRSSETLKATWTFSGTQIYPILGVQPRYKKVCISGTTIFTFQGDRIRQMVLTWNLRETLLKLMGVQTDKVKSAALVGSRFKHYPPTLSDQSLV